MEQLELKPEEKAIDIALGTLIHSRVPNEAIYVEKTDRNNYVTKVGYYYRANLIQNGDDILRDWVVSKEIVAIDESTGKLPKRGIVVFVNRKPVLGECIEVKKVTKNCIFGNIKKAK